MKLRCYVIKSQTRGAFVYSETIVSFLVSGAVFSQDLCWFQWYSSLKLANFLNFCFLGQINHGVN